MIFDKKDAIALPTYKDLAYKMIKESIIFQRFKPDELYSQEEICTELGISRTPVREALLELQKERYISFCRGRGITVVPITETEAKDIREVRICNEKFGARLAAERATDEQIRKIEELLHNAMQVIDGRNAQEMYELDRSFHGAIMEASQNIWLKNSVSDLRDQWLRYENQIAYNAEESSKQVMDEHYRILQSIQKRDPDLAETAMEEHLWAAYRRTMSKRDH